MIYAIHAYENLYGGLHGMEDWNFVETDNEEEVVEIGTEMSYEIMDSYRCIEEELNEFENYNLARIENVAFDIWPLPLAPSLEDCNEKTDEMSYEEIVELYKGDEE